MTEWKHCGLLRKDPDGLCLQVAKPRHEKHSGTFELGTS